MAQVITEYRKARALMAENATTPKGGVWQSLFQEVEKVRHPSFFGCNFCAMWTDVFAHGLSASV